MRKIERTGQFKRDYKQELKGRHRATLETTFVDVINYPAASYLATRSGVLHVSCFSSRSKLRGIEPTEIKRAD